MFFYRLMDGIRTIQRKVFFIIVSGKLKGCENFCIKHLDAVDFSCDISTFFSNVQCLINFEKYNYPGLAGLMYVLVNKQMGE
jgi:hypothetical protein